MASDLRPDDVLLFADICQTLLLHFDLRGVGSAVLWFVMLSVYIIPPMPHDVDAALV